MFSEIKLSDCTANPAQPPSRTTNAALSGLLAAVADTDLILPIVVLRTGSRYVIIDGHRRAEIARVRGDASIAATVLELPRGEESSAYAAAMFAQLDGPARKMTGKEKFWSWATLGDDYLTKMPASFGALVKYVIKIFGRTRAKELALAGAFAPGGCVHIGSAHVFLGAWGYDAITLRELGEWVVATGSQSYLYAIASTGSRKEASKLARCVRAGKPYEMPKRRLGGRKPRASA